MLSEVEVAYVDVESQYWILLPIALKSRNLGRKLVVLLLSLWSCSMVSLWLLSWLWSLLLSLRLLRRILAWCWWLLWIASIFSGYCGWTTAGVLVHVAILLGVFTIGRCLRR